MFMVLLIIALFTLAACGKTDESTAHSEDPSATEQHTNDSTGDSAHELKGNPSSNDSTQEAMDGANESAQNVDGGASSSTQSDNSTTENASHTTSSEQTKQASNSKDGASSSGNKTTKLTKDQYLNKLNEMDEADRHADVGETMKELVEQEEARFEKWDAELNKIYGILKEQLTEEQMNNLREEQRNWIKQRDKDAKASSEKYKGGSYESLEYVATKASLSKDRCYELVSKYIY